MDTKELYEQKYKTNIILEDEPCLFMIDFQMGAFFPGDCVDNMYENANPHCLRLLTLFRYLHFPIIHFWLDENKFFQRNKRRRSYPNPFISTNKIFPAFQPLPGELVVEKPDRSAFFETGIENFLTEHNIQTIFLAGTTTCGCIRATATHGDMLGYTMIIPEQCVWDRSLEVHNANIFDMRYKIAEVWDMKRVDEEISRYILSKNVSEIHKRVMSKDK